MSRMSPLRRESWTRVGLHATSCVTPTDPRIAWNAVILALLNEMCYVMCRWCTGNCHGNVDAATTPATDWPPGRLYKIPGGTTSAGERGRLSRLRPASQPHQHRRPRRRQALALPRARLASGGSLRLVYRRQPPVTMADYRVYVYAGARRASGPNHARGGNH